MIENHLQILEDSLLKKLEILQQITEENVRQKEILTSTAVSAEAFNNSINVKGTLAEQLTRLDDGFETLYNDIREQLLVEKDKYKEQISQIQSLVREVVDRSMEVQAQEARNKGLAEAYFSRMKQEIQKGRISSRVSMDYYKNMNKTNVVTPQFLDKKK